MYDNYLYKAFKSLVITEKGITVPLKINVM